MVGLNENKDAVEDVFVKYTKLTNRSIENRIRASELASNGERIRHKSSVPPDHFLKYLKSRIEKWENLSEKPGNGNQFAKRMLVKTNELIASISQ